MSRAAEVIRSCGLEALSLRGLARDLNVSHGAPNRHFKSKADLLAALATEGYAGLTAATLAAADNVGADPWLNHNAMGRGFLHWALDNPASFHAIMHPDLIFYESAELLDALASFRRTIREAVAATQQAGRHPEVSLDVLSLFTNAVPMGAAMMLASPSHSNATLAAADQERLVDELIELVVPIRGRLLA